MRRFYLFVSLFGIFFLCTLASYNPSQADETKNLSVSAVVAAQESDFVNSISRLTSGSSFPQNTEIEYELTYGTSLGNSTNFTLEAQWYTGTIQSSSGSVDIVSYVSGSATDGYGSTAPVIDLTNKKITWEFSTFPASTTNQTVRFKLKTNSAYTGSSTVSFNTAVRIVGPGVTTTGETISTTYQYDSSLETTPTPTVTPTAGPTATPTPGTSSGATSTPTPTPTSTPGSLTITSIKPDSIQDTSVEFSFTTNRPTSYSINYGTSVKNMNQKITDVNKSRGHTFRLTDLNPNTIYYFRIIATDTNGKTIYSDIYTFKTASTNLEGLINVAETNLTWEKLLLTSRSKNTIFTIPGRPLTITVSIPNSNTIKSIFAEIENSNVLGITTYADEPETTQTYLTEILPGLFSGEFLTPLDTSKTYRVHLQVRDIYGGLTSSYLPFTIVNSRPLTILDAKSHLPVENAELSFAIYNDRLKTFNQLDQSFKLPQYSEADGHADVMLPEGKYKLTINLESYAQKTVIFDLGSDGKYPAIYIEPEMSLTGKAMFLGSSGSAMLLFLQDAANSLLSSPRTREFVFISNMILMLVMFVMILYRQRTEHPEQRTFMQWIIHMYVIVFIDIFIVGGFAVSILFTFKQEYLQGFTLLWSGLINSTLWFMYARKVWKIDQQNPSLSHQKAQ